VDGAGYVNTGAAKEGLEMASEKAKDALRHDS
jgi:hypothetical protein